MTEESGCKNPECKCEGCSCDPCECTEENPCKCMLDNNEMKHWVVM
jgi:hypothetical protein